MFIILPILLIIIALGLTCTAMVCLTRDDVGKTSICIFLAIVTLAGAIILETSTEKIFCAETKQEVISIYAGHEDTQIQGKFYIHGGYINEEKVIYYWVDNNGVKTEHSFPMDASSFVEDNGNYAVETIQVCKEASGLQPERVQHMEFHIPEGSIAQIFSFE